MNRMKPDLFLRCLKFILHPVLMALSATFFFEPIQVIMIGMMILSAHLYFYK